MFYVYVHTVPNGKMYIGQTKDLSHRWQNGEGYEDNQKFYNDIKIYGWNNIKHEIVAEFPERESALILEAVLISLLKTEDDNYGYNQTSIYKNAMCQFAKKQEVNFVSLERQNPDDSFFEAYNLPLSVCNEMIDQWIFNDRYRTIAKRRLLDGLSYEQLSKETSLSKRQLIRIVQTCCEKLSKHL